jgi:hypothetical protein
MTTLALGVLPAASTVTVFSPALSVKVPRLTQVRLFCV